MALKRRKEEVCAYMPVPVRVRVYTRVRVIVAEQSFSVRSVVWISGCCIQVGNLQEEVKNSQQSSEVRN